jgi:hypothetical protein
VLGIVSASALAAAKPSSKPTLSASILASSMPSARISRSSPASSLVAMLLLFGGFFFEVLAFEKLMVFAVWIVVPLFREAMLVAVWIALLMFLL